MNNNEMRPAIPPLSQDAACTASAQTGSQNGRPPVANHLPSPRSEADKFSPWGAIIQSLVGEKPQRNPTDVPQ